MKCRTKLKEIIDKKGLKQRKIAKDLDIHYVVFSTYVTGKSVPTLERAKKIADYFNMKIEDIFFDKNIHNVNDL
ncbi:unnamed protein product [marine sediment metagenome]|uniref:HTH cro/C1-type domain-containing protein n=1 Tax=marine sediment metagenome TaxID=412755 RepID=X1R8R9_9ZZZZ